jgi:addiction module RelE/StbE family toxin
MTDKQHKKRLEFSPVFQQLLVHAPGKIKQAVQDALDLFEEDPHSPALRNHSLSGKYQDFRSIDVTEDWRALYREESERFVFSELGTHTQLYG